MKKIALLVLLFACVISNSSAQSFVIENNELIVPSPITFEANSARLTPASDSALTYVKQYLDSKTYISLLRVEGHVNGGANDQKLSEQRAVAVSKRLIEMGMDCKRLLSVGFGNSKPVDDGSSPGKSLNTRITFKNAELKGRPIGGLPIDGGGNIAGDTCL